MTDEVLYDYWWAAMPRANHVRVGAIAFAAGSTRRLFEAGKSELMSIEGISEKHADDIIKRRSGWDPEGEYDKFINTGARFVPWYSDEYPKRLKDIHGKPFALFAAGSLPDDGAMSVAVIGARNCSGYGRMMAQKFGSDLGAAGISVISGMAYGIDGISQTAALDAGGVSFGILGCGVNTCYPSSNRKLYDRLKESGGVISEYGIYTEPRACFFPARNRIISALSDAVVVIEARKESGTMITVDMALEQGREVAIVPGRITDPLSTGCISLWKQGAVPVTCAEDVISLVKGSYSVSENEPVLMKVSLPDDEKKIYALLEPYAISVGELSDMAGMELRKVLLSLVELCLKGLAAEVSTGHYVKVRECLVV
ncbi:MAG: DNA-processing protein DprA [Lachnospiraceae bacterium]|nr:DNA-processing protein DprA [Lachnospiraceae bacterium]